MTPNPMQPGGPSGAAGEPNYGETSRRVQEDAEQALQSAKRQLNDVLDGIMEAYMEQNRSPQEIVAQGHAPADVRRVVDLIRRSEYKRRQAPPGVRITLRGFGKDWRYPITSRYRDSGGLSL